MSKYGACNRFCRALSRVDLPEEDVPFRKMIVDK